MLCGAAVVAATAWDSGDHDAARNQLTAVLSQARTLGYL